MIRIVADDRIPFLKGALESVARVDYLPGAAITGKDLADADALITRTRTRCDRQLLEGSGIRFIATATIGFDHIDTDYCSEAGIAWSSAPGCNAGSVRQYLVSTLLYLSALRGLDLSTMTIGVIGVGNVGSRVASAAESLGMKVLLNDPPRAEKEGPDGFMRLDQLLERSDIISLHVPLNRGGKHNTIHMVDRDFIRRSRKGVILINTSRGGVVKERDLLEGISNGHLSDVVLDVFEHEPDINLELLNAITLGTPHIAGYSTDGKANGTTTCVRAVSRFFGLGLDRWEPEAIPLPSEEQLYADASEGQLQEIAWQLYRKTYDVKEDDSKLRNDPGAFEQLRGAYPVRREPAAYTVQLFQGYPEINRLLEKLEFTVLKDKNKNKHES